MELIIKNTVLDLLAGLGFLEASATVRRDPSTGETEHYTVSIACDPAPLLIGRHGDSLLAFQHMLKLIIGRKAEELGRKATLIIDVDDYRKRQVEEAIELASRRAAQVQQSGNSVKLFPMSSFVRRAVHLHLEEHFPEITTDSVGYGSARAVVIRRRA